MIFGDIEQLRGVAREEEWPEAGPLGYHMTAVKHFGEHTFDEHSLRAIGRLGAEPLKSCTTDTKLALQTSDQGLVTHKCLNKTTSQP